MILWSILINICEDHRSKIDRDIIYKILKIGFKRNVEDMIAVLKPVVKAINVLKKKKKKNHCSLAECVFGKITGKWLQSPRSQF